MGFAEKDKIDLICLLGTADAHGFYEKFGFQSSDQMKRLPTKEEPNPL